MRKIINGRRYDTETAYEIAEDSNSLSRSDWHYCREKLYQKRNGEFFLCGEGGALTKYAEYVPGCGRTNGEGIVPLSEEEAKAWVERVCDYDTYCDLFDEPEE